MIKTVLKFRFVFLAAIALVVFGCLDEIDFDVPAENQTSLVIQGRLVKGNPHNIKIEVERLFDFNGGSSNIRVQYVRVTNDLGQSIDLPNSSLGIYEMPIPVDDPDFEIRTGGSYMVTVQTLDDRKYESNFEILHPVPKVAGITPVAIQREVITGIGTEFRDGVRYLLNTPLAVPGETDKQTMSMSKKSNHLMVIF